VGVVMHFRDITRRARYEKTAVQPLGGGKHWPPLFWVDPVGRCVVYANKAATNNWTTASKAFIGWTSTPWTLTSRAGAGLYQTTFEISQDARHFEVGFAAAA
jgi:hypothetical protein